MGIPRELRTYYVNQTITYSQSCSLGFENTRIIDVHHQDLDLSKVLNCVSNLETNLEKQETPQPPEHASAVTLLHAVYYLINLFSDINYNDFTTV